MVGVGTNNRRKLAVEAGKHHRIYDAASHEPLLVNYTVIIKSTKVSGTLSPN